MPHVVPQFGPTRPATGVGEALFASLATALERWAEFDVIVLDSVPLTVVEDTRLLTPHVTAVARLVPSGRSDERRLNAARKTLRDAGTSILGLVENDVPPVPELELEPERDQEPEPAGRAKGERDAFLRKFGPPDRTSGRRRERRGKDRRRDDR